MNASWATIRLFCQRFHQNVGRLDLECRISGPVGEISAGMRSRWAPQPDVNWLEPLRQFALDLNVGGANSIYAELRSRSSG